MRRLKALVVEPDARVRDRLRRALRRRGFDVISARNRVEASDHLDGSMAHVIVTDDPTRPGSYRVVWLAENVPDASLEPTRGGWRRFDESR